MSTTLHTTHHTDPDPVTPMAPVELSHTDIVNLSPALPVLYQQQTGNPAGCGDCLAGVILRVVVQWPPPNQVQALSAAGVEV